MVCKCSFYGRLQAIFFSFLLKIFDHFFNLKPKPNTKPTHIYLFVWIFPFLRIRFVIFLIYKAIGHAIYLCIDGMPLIIIQHYLGDSVLSSVSIQYSNVNVGISKSERGNSTLITQLPYLRIAAGFPYSL